MSSPLQKDKQVKHTSNRLHQSHRAKGAPIMEVIISQCLGLGTWATCGLHAVSTSLTASSKNLTSRLCSARPRPLEAYSWTLALKPQIRSNSASIFGDSFTEQSAKKPNCHHRNWSTSVLWPDLLQTLALNTSCIVQMHRLKCCYQYDLVLFSHHSEHTFSNSTAILAPCCVTDSPQISGTLLSGIAFTDCTATCKPWDAAMGWIATTTSCSRLESFTTQQGAFFDSLSVCLCTVRLKNMIGLCLKEASGFHTPQNSETQPQRERERECVCVCFHLSCMLPVNLAPKYWHEKVQKKS